MPRTNQKKKQRRNADGYVTSSETEDEIAKKAIDTEEAWDRGEAKKALTHTEKISRANAETLAKRSERKGLHKSIHDMGIMDQLIKQDKHLVIFEPEREKWEQEVFDRYSSIGRDITFNPNVSWIDATIFQDNLDVCYKAAIYKLAACSSSNVGSMREIYNKFINDTASIIAKVGSYLPHTVTAIVNADTERITTMYTKAVECLGGDPRGDKALAQIEDAYRRSMLSLTTSPPHLGPSIIESFEAKLDNILSSQLTEKKKKIENPRVVEAREFFNTMTPSEKFESLLKTVNLSDHEVLHSVSSSVYAKLPSLDFDNNPVSVKEFILSAVRKIDNAGIRKSNSPRTPDDSWSDDNDIPAKLSDLKEIKSSIAELTTLVTQLTKNQMKYTPQSKQKKENQRVQVVNPGARSLNLQSSPPLKNPVRGEQDAVSEAARKLVETIIQLSPSALPSAERSPL